MKPAKKANGRRERVAIALVSSSALAVTGLLAATPASAAEYSSALKVSGVAYDAPGRDNNSRYGGNTYKEYVKIKNYSRSSTVNLKGYQVKDAAGHRYTFSKNHYLQPGDYVKLRGGYGTESDGKNVAYRNNANFIWNNGGDTIYLYKPSKARADVHAYTKSRNDRDGNGYITFHR
nr:MULTISPECIES: lamin tail domain-containing protein [unclassified Streptomyces]